MAIGKMQHSVVIQTKSRSADGGGGSAVTFSDVATVFARIEATGGSERLFGDQLEGVTTHTITIRHRRDVTAANRIKYAFAVDSTNYERLFNINRVENVGERDKYLKLYCTEGVAT